LLFPRPKKTINILGFNGAGFVPVSEKDPRKQKKYFLPIKKNVLAYYSAGVVVVNTKS
jgi:hypothetical protein